MWSLFVAWIWHSVTKQRHCCRAARGSGFGVGTKLRWREARQKVLDVSFSSCTALTFCHCPDISKKKSSTSLGPKFGVWSLEFRQRVRRPRYKVRKAGWGYILSRMEKSQTISIYELQNSYMTQGLYSFSEVRHESKRKEQSEVQMGQSKSEKIRVRYRGMEHGQDNKSEGYRGSRILETGAKQQETREQ